MHASKGLEFPVVFLCAMSREFNMMSLNSEVLCHKDLGIGLPFVDLEKRVKYPSIARRAISACMKAEMISEEMRILYVAMTRAREQLYIYGFTSDNNANEMSWHSQLWRVFQTIPNAEITDDKIRITNVDPNA
jgi:ATP-dependent helicase/nuclease subunit A